MLEKQEKTHRPHSVITNRHLEAEAVTHIRAGSLLAKGFSPRSIWLLMGPPAHSKTKHPFPKELQHHYYEEATTPPGVIHPSATFPKELQHHYYEEATAGAAAATKEFQLLRLTELLSKRRAALQQLPLMQATLQWAKTINIRTTFPSVDTEDLMERATKQRAAWDWPNGIPPVLQEPTPELQAVWAYTYLKHEYTNYDEVCDQIKGKAFSRYAQPVILHRVNRLILDRFPTLPVRGGTGPETRTCKRCGTKKTGHFNGYYWTTPLDWYAKAKAHKNHTIHDFCSLRCAGEYSQGQARAPLARATMGEAKPTQKAKP